MPVIVAGNWEGSEADCFPPLRSSRISDVPTIIWLDSWDSRARRCGLVHSFRVRVVPWGGTSGAHVIRWPDCSKLKYMGSVPQRNALIVVKCCLRFTPRNKTAGRWNLTKSSLRIVATDGGSQWIFDVPGRVIGTVFCFKCFFFVKFVLLNTILVFSCLFGYFWIGIPFYACSVEPMILSIYLIGWRCSG